MNALYYLRLQAARGLGPAAQRAILACVQAKDIGLGDFFAASQSVWREAGLTPDQADALAASAADAEEWHRKIESCGIQIVGYLDEAYPARLKRVLQQLAPPVLYIKL